MTDEPAPPTASDHPAVADDYLNTFTPVPTRARRDGWTGDKQRRFIAALRRSGSVGAAARAVDMSHQSAWRLRARPKAEAFAAAWERALDEARCDALDEALKRTRHGVLIPRTYRGRYVGLIHRYDDRLALSVLRHPARPPGR